MKQVVPATADSTSAKSDAEVRTITAKQIRALVDERKGKVVVVNFWASWCPPCMREFPAIIKVYEQYRDKGVDMFAVSLNAPEDKADIEQFVKEFKPPFPIYLEEVQDETFSETVLEDWSGEMPLTLVFDTAGKRVLAHRSELTYQELSKRWKRFCPAIGQLRGVKRVVRLASSERDWGRWVRQSTKRYRTK